MEVFDLPDDLNDKGNSPYTLFDYQSFQERAKQKVILSQNVFSFLMEGRKEIIAGTSSMAINVADFVLIKSGRRLMTEKLSSTNHQYRSILLFFSNDAIFRFVKKYDINNPENYKSQPIYKFKYDHFLSTFVKSLIEILQLNTAVQSKILELKFEEVMVYLMETRGVQFIQSLLQEINEQTSQIIKVVENNRLNKLTIKELAFLSNMSISTFKREFEKIYNESPIKWFQNERLKHSAYLLIKEAKRPSEVYEQVGYESLSNFIQAFKTKFGVTPKQYQLD